MNQEQICIKRAHNICTFDRDIAENFGLEEAVFVMYLQQSIDTAFEIKRHKPEEVELIVKDGLVWKPWTVDQLSQEIRFWTPKQIRRIKDSCVKQGIIRVDFLDIDPMDRRLWYAVVK